MNKGKLIASIAVGAAIALFMIPATRRIITDAVSSLTDSIKGMASNAAEAADSAKKLAST